MITTSASLSELFADAHAAERALEVQRRGAALRTWQVLEARFRGALGNRVWTALDAAGYVAVGVPGHAAAASGIGAHVWLRKRGDEPRGRFGVHAVEQRDGDWYVTLETATESSARKGVPVTHLANVVLLMVERLEKSEAPAPRGGRLDTVG